MLMDSFANIMTCLSKALHVVRSSVSGTMCCLSCSRCPVGSCSSISHLMMCSVVFVALLSSCFLFTSFSLWLWIFFLQHSATVVCSTHSFFYHCRPDCFSYSPRQLLFTELLVSFCRSLSVWVDLLTGMLC